MGYHMEWVGAGAGFVQHQSMELGGFKGACWQTDTETD